MPVVAGDCNQEILETACFNFLIPHNIGVSNSARVMLCLLALVAAGCGTARRDATRALDWENPDVAAAPTQVPPAAYIAPPPASAPPTPAPGQSPGNIPAPAPNLPTSGWISLRSWSQANGLPAPSRLTSGPAPIYGLRNGHGQFMLQAGSTLAHWDGVELHLGFAPQMIGGEPYLQALDLRKTLQPLFLGPSALGLGVHPVLVIDPGHGGENPGTRSVVGNHYEKQFTLDWALRVQAMLATNGWRVYLTRSNDSDLALSNRVGFAAQHQADLFLSLHFNAAVPDHGEIGLETYCLTPAGLPSSLTRGFADEVTQAFPNNAFDAQNLQLALSVHRALLQVNGRHDRGIRYARFPGVLRNQPQPAVLVEGGYLSNPREARLIAEPAYRQKLAEAVAKALMTVQSPQSTARSPQPTARTEESAVQSPETTEVSLKPPAVREQHPEPAVENPRSTATGPRPKIQSPRAGERSQESGTQGRKSKVVS